MKNVKSTKFQLLTPERVAELRANLDRVSFSPTIAELLDVYAESERRRERLREELGEAANALHEAYLGADDLTASRDAERAERRARAALEEDNR